MEVAVNRPRFKREGLGLNLAAALVTYEAQPSGHFPPEDAGCSSSPRLGFRV